MYQIRAIRYSEKGSASGHDAAWALLYNMLEEQYGITPRPDSFCRNQNGKPLLSDHPELYFSISHTGHAAVCVTALHPIGVDCEKKTRPVSARVRNRMLNGFGGQDSEAIRLWTCLESRVKLYGTSVFLPGFQYEALFDGTCFFSYEDDLLDGEFAVTVCEYAEDKCRE